MAIIDAGDPQPSRAQVFAQAVMAALKDDTVAGHFGRKYLAEYDQARRVVFVPQGGSIEAPKIASDKRVTDDAGSRAPACAVCIESLEVHIYAETLGLLEQLKDSLIAAAVRQLYASPTAVIPTTYGWASQEPGAAGETNRTEKIVLVMDLRLPVPELIRPLRRAEEFTDVCGTIQPNGSVTPQP